jgi:hypothetical protein
MANVGVAPREVRLVLLTLGLLAGGVSSAAFSEQILDVTLALITILATITTIQRIVHVTRQNPPESTSASTPGGDEHP